MPRILIAVLISGCLLSVPAYAKGKQGPPPKPLTVNDIVAKLKIQLELTDKQAEEVKPIITNYLAEEQQAKLEEKRQLAKVLTSDQMYAWNFLQNEPPHEKKRSKM